MTYAEKLKDPRWQRKRLEIMERDGFACRDCKSTEKTLEVHHCAYRGGDPWQTPDALLMTLCSECHHLRQSTEREIKRMFEDSFSVSDINSLYAVSDVLKTASEYSLKLVIVAVDDDGGVMVSSSRHVKTASQTDAL